MMFEDIPAIVTIITIKTTNSRTIKMNPNVCFVGIYTNIKVSTFRLRIPVLHEISSGV